MQNSFVENIKENNLFSPEDNILLAISGGIDSMVLLHLFINSGLKFGVAHCNFQLRGEESDKDEEFVRNETAKCGTPFYFERFDTEEYAKLSGISIEMAARELRYEFFEKIRLENSYDFIATAHHQDDVIETFFLNLSRKTGIKGLTGIKEKSGKIIRPLLFTNRQQIKKYALENDIAYREDSSNYEIIYQRNLIRNKILPLFFNINPAFNANVLASIQNLKETETVYNDFIQAEIERISQKNDGHIAIDIAKISNCKHGKVILFELLTEYNFNASVVNKVYSSLQAEPGKQFFSKTHRLVKDREFFFLSEIKPDENRKFYIDEEDLELFEPFDLTIQKTNAEDFVIDKSTNVACIDLALIQFPLLVRKWQAGDHFQPLGMQGFKKVSDFLIDQKIPLHEKENVWLLCSGKKIIWVIGLRIDDRFKITPKTKTVYKIELVKQTI